MTLPITLPTMTRRHGLHLLTAASLMALGPIQSLAQPAASAADRKELAPARDDLVTAFRGPPKDARPRVWWHWLNGNVTQKGIAEDLAWLRRIGVAGLQNFDASVDAPQIVDKRLSYMSPEWKDALRHAVSQADALGMEYGIAASPGWSETGGPWVTPEDAMKKLVWSKADIAGGKRFTGTLPKPSAAPGPFQDIRRAPDHGYAAPDHYRDARVVAYRHLAPSITAMPRSVTVNGEAIDPSVLFDTNHDSGIAPPSSMQGKPGAITFVYDKPQTLRSFTMFIRDLPPQSFAGPLVPQLDSSEDGKAWRKVASIGLAPLPTTSSFAPVTARYFRIVFVRGERTNRSSFRPAPGADLRAAAGVGGATGSAPRLALLRLSAEACINAAEKKAGFALADDYYALDGEVGDDAAGTSPADVIDLTTRMRADGTLEWTPPPGNWTVLRMGYSLTGQTNAPATREATGLEVDKYDASAVRRYLTTYLDKYRSAVGDALIGKRGITMLVTDSTEVGPSNWTPRVLDHFRKLRGYDPLPWLPALTGAIVGSRSRSDAFLYDFRRTLSDLTVSQHYATIAAVAKENGLTVYGESLEGGRAISTLGDDLDMRRHADVPMAAMWSYGAAPAPNLVADMRGAASVAHVYGRRFVAAESLTSILNPWAYAPGDLQPMIDAEFLAGVNRPFLHSVVHQPRDDRKPGLSLAGFGQHFNRHETWAEMARPWMDYIARTSFLLQQGRNVADVAYFYGEEAPVSVQAEKGYPTDVPSRHAYDFVSADMMLNALSARNGELVSEGGARYRALYLGGTSSRMTVPVLRKLVSFAQAGVAIVGERPLSSPSLHDDTTEFDRLATQIWGPPDGSQPLAMAMKIDAALENLGIVPDFTYSGAADGEIQFAHRTGDDGEEIYFVSNRAREPRSIEARFRVSGRTAETWHADTGQTQDASYRIEGAQTVVPLQLQGGQSVFVVFRNAAEEPVRTIAPLRDKVVKAEIGPWSVRFQSERGAPRALELDSLQSLSSRPEPGIRYFSGTASYSTRLNLPEGKPRKGTLMLDLGEVGDVAQVRINGQLAGTLWKKPYHMDIGPFARRGANTVEIDVANLWVNRLIGDQQPDAQKIAFVTGPTFTQKAPLRPSGLIGPVVVTKVID